ncbi:unnamed protein product [Dovyalis caffra]|uniref:Putative gamma-glutamylcyclotransferase n=1 Tax=Dovyalis caffra TaxID=77055 RepID=A0AAV1SMU3_9ROSI|nr:unnamed protein product [Dovyalis caffra]
MKVVRSGPQLVGRKTHNPLRGLQRFYRAGHESSVERASTGTKVPLRGVQRFSQAGRRLPFEFSIKGRVYPAILPVENKKVSGRVLHGITNPELYILDEFEDVEYERVTVDVSLMDSSDKIQTLAYVWADKKDPNLYGEWDFEAQPQKSKRIRWNQGYNASSLVNYSVSLLRKVVIGLPWLPARLFGKVAVSHK